MDAAPLATGSRQVGSRVEDAAATNFSPFLFRNEFSDDAALLIRQVGAISCYYFYVAFSAIEDLRSSQAAT